MAAEGTSSDSGSIIPLVSDDGNRHAAAMSQRCPLPWLAITFLFALAWSCGHDAPATMRAPSTPSGAALPPASDPSAPKTDMNAPSSPSKAGSDAVSCSQDSDCQLADDYCGSCRCLSLLHGGDPPACTGARVQCFVAPCLGKRAVCQNHGCATGASGGGGI